MMKWYVIVFLGAHSLGTTLLKLQSLTGVGVIQRGEGAGCCWVGFTAVRRQSSRNMTWARVERRSHRGGIERTVQRFQERHGLIPWGDVLRRLPTRTQSVCEPTAAGDGHVMCFITECSSESEVCDVMTGLKLVGDRGLSFFLMARI